MELILEFISNLLVNEGIVIAVAAFVVGQILKGFKKVPNNIIPLVGGLLGIILGIAIPDIFVGKDIVTSGVLGLALGWAATGGYETVRNVKGGK